MVREPFGVLHLIERLTSGGAGRALVTSAAHSIATHGTRHRLLSLRPPHPAAVARADAAGLECAPVENLARELAAADIVHVHFWNTPDLDAVLHAPLPPCRILLTSHVAGTSAPHILTDALVDLADLVALTAPEPTPAILRTVGDKAVLAQEAADFTRIAGAAPAAHAGFNIGYIGAVDFAKMHPRYVALHAGLASEGARVIVCGEGGARRTLDAEIAALGIVDRFELRGYVNDIAPILSTLDVFGYPLCDDSYATTELVLREAMYVGLPCVVLAGTAAAQSVRDGETGFVATGETDYGECIRRLRDDPELRRRMGAAAAARARDHFGAAHLAPRIDAAYARLLLLPKRTRAGSAPLPGSGALLRALGSAAAPFRASLSDDRAGALAADFVIAAASPALASADTGGVLHYRRYYPRDAALRLWAGLVLLGQHRPALAAAEFDAVARLGFDAGRATYHLARAAEAAGSEALARTARARARAAGYQ